MRAVLRPHPDRPDTPDDVPPPSPSRDTLAGIMQSIREMASLSEVLRMVGAAVIVVAMSLFLLQGWSEGNDVTRYLKLLALTGLLGIGGFALAHGLKETKGARVFFGLALVSVPANFTILGALIYSVAQLDGGLTAVPAFATWQLGEAAHIGLTVAGAVAFLAPVTGFCFAIMARHSAKALTLHCLALNLLLLLPVRLSLAAGAVAIAGACYALWAQRRMRARDAALRTPEGRFARTVLFLPLGIVLFRSLCFYEVESLTIALLSATGTFLLRQLSLAQNRSPRVATVFDTLSLPLALTTVFALADTLSFGIEVMAPLSALAFAAFGVDVLRRTPSTTLGRLTSVLVSFSVALGFIISVGVEPGVLTALIAALAGLALALTGLWLSRRSAVLAGLATLLAAGLFGFESIAELVVRASWVALAIVGAAAIGLGSLLERHGVTMKVALQRLARSIDQNGGR